MKKLLGLLLAFALGLSAPSLRAQHQTGGGGGGTATVAIGSGVTGGTPGSVLFIDATSKLAQDATNFTYSGTTNALGLANVLLTPLSAGGTTGSHYLRVQPDTSVSSGFTQISTGTNHGGTNYTQLVWNVFALTGTDPAQGANYFNSYSSWGATDNGTSIHRAYDWGVEGNFSTTFSEKRFYMWAYDNTGANGGTVMVYQQSTAPSFYFGSPSTAADALRVDPEIRWGRLLSDGLKNSVDAPATGTVLSGSFAATLDDNTATTRTYPILQINPTLNGGGSNTTKTVNVLDLDTTNTSLTGFATVNLINARYGGTQQFLVDSAGNVSAASLIQGSVPYVGAAGLITQNNTKLFWDNATLRLGIGTAAPSSTLTVSTNTASLPVTASLLLQVGAADGVQAAGLFDSFAAASTLIIRRANTTAASPSALALNDQIGNFAWQGYQSGGAYSTNRAAVSGFAAEAWTATNQGAYFKFRVTKPATTAITDAWTFSATGDLFSNFAMSQGQTSGFVYISGATGGVPSGTPSATPAANGYPLFFDVTDNKLCVYNGAWKCVVVS